MATRRAQPQLPGRLPAALLAALTAAALAAPAVHAQYQPSGYQKAAGAPFFLLSDKAWSSRDVALVRLELAGEGYGSYEVEQYGGVDVVLYRVPRPLPFLQAQRNLHRIKTDAVPAEEGLANTLSHVWDRWYEATRLAWRRIFSSDARGAVTATAPELKTVPVPPTEFRHPPQFKPLPGFDLVTRFRYPVTKARAIEPPAEVKLAGSSSEFITPREGNVMIPLGRLEPGLYLVEAYAGSHRANTLVFVSDTVAITKTSKQEVLVWAAEREAGAPVPGVQVAWTDGAGVLGTGTTDSRGLARFEHESPERSYVLGADPEGGVFISENFYYDSEIYDTKLYGFTDRPLYRPGDTVFVKLFARQYQDARSSRPVAGGEVQLQAYDPSGVPVAQQKLVLRADSGGETSFTLPPTAGAGGYDLRLLYAGSTYGAAFRVAEYHKPHFEIALVPQKPAFKVKEDVKADVQLRYTDGKPVKGAEVQVTVRQQQLTMVDGELGYYGQFPVKLTAEVERTGEDGVVHLTLPAVEEPSRYVITLLATDGSAARVRTTREILVERGRSSYSVRAERQFSAPHEAVSFALGAAAGEAGEPARTWEWVRLEDRARLQGALASPHKLHLAFPAPGTYSLQLRDAAGNVVGAASHWVSGGALEAPVGSISMVASKERYLPGETAEVLVTFPAEVEEALFTLERDRVEQATLMAGSGAPWVKAQRLSPTQWRARLPVTAALAPNITFSVAYVRNGEYVFQNQGLQVALPRVEVEFRPERQVYQPGETVNVEVKTTVGGQGRPAVVAVGVVDEMIYVLQPEIAPSIDEFFNHVRRNNVRTASSQSFISYDLAASRSKGAPAPGSVSERRVKVLERPRRDEKDTAFWEPSLRTDSRGRARFSFVMPDALTRWRLTGRALTGEGVVGQRTAYLRSEKDVYLKWTSPEWMRAGDAPVATLAAFNQTSRPLSLELAVSGPGLERLETVTLQPGLNVLEQDLETLTGEGRIAASLRRGGKVVDALETRFDLRPLAWRAPHSLNLAVSGAETALPLPPDAREVQVTFAAGAAGQFRRIADDLLEYPYGCAEQTASRIIPLALGLEAFGSSDPRLSDRLRQQLNANRMRLAYLASPKARFTWWGPFTSEDPFVTTYAYYADWLAARALGLTLPEEHWNALLEVYRESGPERPLAQRALMLNAMQDMGLPVQALADAFLEDLLKAPAPHPARPRLPALDSPFLGDPAGGAAQDLALLLAERLFRAQRRELPSHLATRVALASESLRAEARPLSLALLLANGRLPAGEAEHVLQAVAPEMPTLERALTLAFVRQALGPLGAPETAPALQAPWQRVTTAHGASAWRWTGDQAPRELRLGAAPPAALTATVEFTSAEPETSKLPVKVERVLYRLVRTEPGDDEEEGAEAGWSTEFVEPGAPLSTTDLYLDSITLSSEGDGARRYGVLEVPLPPGAFVESTTWGIHFEDEEEGLEKARHQPTSYGYAVPVDPIAGKQTVRHLLRFGQKGRFSLPPSRLYPMYLPEKKAFDIDGLLDELVVQ